MPKCQTESCQSSWQCLSTLERGYSTPPPSAPLCCCRHPRLSVSHMLQTPNQPTKLGWESHRIQDSDGDLDQVALGQSAQTNKLYIETMFSIHMVLLGKCTCIFLVRVEGAKLTNPFQESVTSGLPPKRSCASSWIRSLLAVFVFSLSSGLWLVHFGKLILWTGSSEFCV